MRLCVRMRDEALERTEVNNTPTTTAHCQRARAFLHAVCNFYLRGSRSTGGSANRVKKKRVFTRNHSGPHHPFARTHMAMHCTHSPVTVDTNTRRADLHLRMPIAQSAHSRLRSLLRCIAERASPISHR